MKTDLRDQLAIILGCFIAAVGLLPWCLIWLSDRFFFDITAKLMWIVLFGGPAILTMAAMTGVLLCSWLRHHREVLHRAIR